MEKNKLDCSGWDSDEDLNKTNSRLEGNEMSVYVQTHSEETEKADVGKGDLDRRKCSLKHFVEESTLRNVALDELEELSDTGVNAADGVIGRTSSSVSSDQAPMKQAIILGLDPNYFNKPEGLLRVALLSCSTLSLGCVASAGTSDIDVLQLPVSSYIRAHIFVAIFSLLITSAFFFIGITSIVESFPLHWNIVDAAMNASLSTLFIFSSSMLLHAEQEYHRWEPAISDWTKVQMSLAAVFGFLSTLVCVFLTIIRSCTNPTPVAHEDIRLSSIHTS